MVAEITELNECPVPGSGAASVNGDLWVTTIGAAKSLVEYPTLQLHARPLISAPASRSNRALTNTAISEIAVTVQNAAEKSANIGVARACQTMEACSAVPAVQMPSDSISCWKVE